MRQHALEMRQKVQEMERQLERLCNVDFSDMASAKEAQRIKQTLQAVFQASFVDQGSQVQEAVATREGATISVVNPQAERRLDVTDGVVQELLAAMQQEIEELESRQESKKWGGRR